MRRVFDACRRYFVTALLFSLAINLLYLASPLYMLQVYDRVVSSGSHVTLVMLTLVLLVALAALAGLDSVRARILARASIHLDRLLAGRVVTVTMESAARGATARSQPLRRVLPPSVRIALSSDLLRCVNKRECRGKSCAHDVLLCEDMAETGAFTAKSRSCRTPPKRTRLCGCPAAPASPPISPTPQRE